MGLIHVHPETVGEEAMLPQRATQFRFVTPGLGIQLFAPILSRALRRRHTKGAVPRGTHTTIDLDPHPHPATGSALRSTDPGADTRRRSPESTTSRCSCLTCLRDNPLEGQLDSTRFNAPRRLNRSRCGGTRWVVGPCHSSTLVHVWQLSPHGAIGANRN